MSTLTQPSRPSATELRPWPQRRVLARWLCWLAVGAAVLAGAILFVVLTGVRPAYDAFGWLTWGRQALHWNLDTNAAPSWKPLTFLFTFPFALAGRGAVWLWMVTATAAALAAPIPAGRIAYRLAGGGAGGGIGPVIGGVFAGIAVIGLKGYWHFVMIFTADPMIVGLCLAAIDCHLSGRPRAAFTFLALAALGRPEAFPFAVLYALWTWWKRPSLRAYVAIGLVLTVALWIVIPALTSKSWFSPGNTALTASTPLRGNKLTGVIDNFLSLYELPMQLAALAALVLAVVKRQRTQLLLAAAAVLWVAIWVGFALHGWEPDPRYMFEAAAVEAVLVGAAVGSVLSLGLRRGWLGWVGLAAVAALVIALVPVGRIRLRLAHNGMFLGRSWALQIDRLQAVIARDGGPKRILACAPVASTVSYQSILAWHIGQNVADVGWTPAKLIRSGKPIVLFWPHLAGWQVRPIHIAGPKRSSCARLRRNTPFHSPWTIGTHA